MPRDLTPEIVFEEETSRHRHWLARVLGLLLLSYVVVVLVRAAGLVHWSWWLVATWPILLTWAVALAVLGGGLLWALLTVLLRRRP